MRWCHQNQLIFMISPERRRIAKIFQTHIQQAIEEIGIDYDVTLQGRFDTKPIRIETRNKLARRNTLGENGANFIESCFPIGLDNRLRFFINHYLACRLSRR
jgi:hypothetical protein